MRPIFLCTVFLTLALSAGSVAADDITDRLNAAIAANDAGDLKTASAELAAASKALSARKAALLDALLPPAPEGWTRTLTENYAETLAMAGGGSGAEARYDAPEGTYVNINYIMDSPLLAMMMSMFGNPQMLAMMGKTVELGGATYLDQDNSLVTLVDQRIMVTINGAPTDQLTPFAQAIDAAALATFDAP